MMARNRNVGSLDRVNIFCQYTLCPARLTRACNRFAEGRRQLEVGWNDMIVLDSTSRTICIARRSWRRMLPPEQQSLHEA